MREWKLGRALLMLLVLFCVTGPAHARPNEAAFTRQMADRFRAALPGHAVEITGEPMQLRIAATPDPLTVNIGRIFNYCESAAAQDCAESIDRFVAGSTEGLLHPTPPVTRAQLRLLVRNIEYCDAIGHVASGDTDGPIMRAFLPGLCTLLMADYPTTMRSVTATQLRGLGLEPDAAWVLAERQTLADLPRPDRLEGLDDRVVAVTGYDYVTSLMLNAEGWRAAAAAQGELVVAVPDGGSMIVVRRANLADLPRFRALFASRWRPPSAGCHRMSIIGRRRDGRCWSERRLVTIVAGAGTCAGGDQSRTGCVARYMMQSCTISSS